jgi:hypothetical protein
MATPYSSILCCTHYDTCFLQTLVLPPSVQSEVDVQSILVRSKPFSDAEDLLPVCYRCSTTNPLLNTQVRTSSHTYREDACYVGLTGPLPRSFSSGSGCLAGVLHLAELHWPAELSPELQLAGINLLFL